jgi:hypothetical protein
MTRTLKIKALVFVIVAWLLLGQMVYAGVSTEHAGAAFDVASIYSVATAWTPRVTLTRSALEELRERMARYKYPTGICITGAYERDCRAPESLEEAWLLERLYGRAPRWVLDIVPLQELAKPSLDPGEMFWVDEVRGIRVSIHTTKTVSHLWVELCRDVIRVYELDA